MTDTFNHRAALAGQVIEDVTFEALSAERFTAALLGSRREPSYKDGGFFVFADVPPGDYTLRLSGERLQAQEFGVTLPLGQVVFEREGDNELAVVVKSASTQGGSGRITFDPVPLRRPIRRGALVLGPSGFTTTLAVQLEAGRAAGATLQTVAGLAAGAIVRIVRDKSVRLKFDPYYTAAPELTSVVGRVADAGPGARPLGGARVRLTKVNNVAVAVETVAGVRLATVGAGTDKFVLGTETDALTFANQSGDYNLYFTRTDITAVEVEASLAGFATATQSLGVTPQARNRADFQLTKV